MAGLPLTIPTSTTSQITPTDTTTSTPLTTTTTSATSSLTLGPGPVTSSDTSISSQITSSTDTTTTTTPLTTTTSSTTIPTLPPTTTTTSSLATTTSAISILTSTSIIAVTPASSPTVSEASTHSSNKSFFQNTGAVAGVFTVVGLIVLALLIAFCFNISRRRRQRQFDRETEEAATEAANAQAPAFLDDETDIYGPPAPASTGAYHDSGGYHDPHPSYGYAAENNGGYSDVSSHGTYSQPPMSHPESYNMRELSSPPQELYGVPYTPSNASTAGQAGVGVARARSTLLSSRAAPGGDPAIAFASGLQEGSTPYPAFAGPGAYSSGAYGVDGVKRGMSLSHSQSPPPQLQPGLYNPHEEYPQQPDVTRNPSATTYGTSATYVSGAQSPKTYPVEPVHEAYATGQESVYEGDEGLAYGGYEDEYEGEHAQRVLKVANE